MYWNDEELTVEPYDSINKIYYCGRQLKTYSCGKSVLYTILVVDLSECYCANVMSDGEIIKLFEDTSLVPKKHKKGGQSAARFGRLRENEIIQWFKNINEKLKNIDGNISLGISDIYYKRFWAYLSTYNKEKVSTHRSSAYSGLTGIYDVINSLKRIKSH